MTEKELKSWIFAWTKDVNGTPLDSEINDLIYMVDAHLAPKLKRVDLNKFKMEEVGSYSSAYNDAIDDIKSKYGDLYTIERTKNE